MLADWKIFWCSGWLSNDPAAKHGHVQAVSKWGISALYFSFFSWCVGQSILVSISSTTEQGKMHMLVHVALLFGCKSSFSYVPPSPDSLSHCHHTPCFSLSPALSPAAKHRERQSLLISVRQKAAAPVSFPGQDAMGNTSWHFG